MMEGHAPSWPLALDLTDATERLPPEMLMSRRLGGRERGERRDSSLLAVAHNDRGLRQRDVEVCVILRKRSDRRIWVGVLGNCWDLGD